jgi:hypothetical protein
MSLENIRRLDNSQVKVSLQNDEEGFIGRECPQAGCLGYFKIQLGTGLKGEDLPCNCPYCGFSAAQDQFFTKEQIEYAQSVAVRSVSDPALAAHLIPNGLEDAVSAFDGFGREVCRVRADRIGDPNKGKQISFQNLLGVRDSIRMHWGFDFSASLTPDEWQFACRCFQKRHLLAHKMGIVDEAYLRNAADVTAILGRKISIKPDEVRSLAAILRRLGTALSNGLRTNP